MADSIKGLKNVQMTFKALAKEIEKKQKTALKLAAVAYQNDVKKKAPYLTGTYRRSIHTQMVSSSRALVGTNLPYGKRLEYGYADTDKLGRTYNQVAQPHFRPAMDEGIDRYVKIYLEGLY